MSLGTFQFRESCDRRFLDLDDVEKGAVVSLTNMKNDTSTRIQSPLTALRNETTDELENTAPRIVYRINNAKMPILKDEYMHEVEIVEPIRTSKNIAKQTCCKKAVQNGSLSSTRASDKISFATRIALARPEVHITYSITAQGEVLQVLCSKANSAPKRPIRATKDPYRREYAPRNRSHPEAPLISPESAARSKSKSKRRIVTPAHVVPASETDSAQLPSPSVTPTSSRVGVAQPAHLELPAHGYSCDIVMPAYDNSSDVALPTLGYFSDIAIPTNGYSSAAVMASRGSSAAATITNKGCPSSFAMPSLSSSSAVTVPQAAKTRNHPGHTYPELITKAITESANGRLKVSELYAILPKLSPNLMNKLAPLNELCKGKKHKSAEDVFQENVRQNLSRNKSLFRNVKNPQSGKSAGFWELAITATAPTTPISPKFLEDPSSSGSSPPDTISSSSSVAASFLKRKFSPDNDETPSKRARTAKR